MSKDRFDDDQLDAQATEYARGDYPAGTLHSDATPLDSFMAGIIGTGLHAWTESKARAAAVARFRAWVDGEHDERPTRSELRGDGALVLDELDRVAALAMERGGEIAKLHREVDALRAQRDDAVRERDQWVNEHATVSDALEELGNERDELKRRLVQAQRERDSFRVELVDVKRIRDSWQSQAQARARAVTRLQERVETLAERARESADAQGDYVLLRLRGSGRPEVVEVTAWDEHDDGSVGVAGFRIRDRG